jgi:hypothetical protein
MVTPRNVGGKSITTVRLREEVSEESGSGRFTQNFTFFFFVCLGDSSSLHFFGKESQSGFSFEALVT